MTEWNVLVPRFSGGRRRLGRRISVSRSKVYAIGIGEDLFPPDAGDPVYVTVMTAGRVLGLRPGPGPDTVLARRNGMSGFVYYLRSQPLKRWLEELGIGPGQYPASVEDDGTIVVDFS